MTRYPSVSRACHQLGRHRSGTPNNAVAIVPSPAAVLIGAQMRRIQAGMGAVLVSVSQQMRSRRAAS